MEERQRQLRVLAVDDDEAIRLLVADVLREAGCLVFTACDGEEAVEILETEPIDLLITDYRMPRMNGLELIRWSRERFPYMARTMMTGDPRETVTTDAWTSGADRILLKPFSFDHLLLLVGDLRGAMVAV